jgi:hypothetical protein
MAAEGGAWVSTAHGASHKPGGGDEITPADIGAVTSDQLEGPDAAKLAALESRLAAVEAALNAHKAQKAGVAHK